MAPFFHEPHDMVVAAAAASSTPFPAAFLLRDSCHRLLLFDKLDFLAVLNPAFSA